MSESIKAARFQFFKKHRLLQTQLSSKIAAKRLCCSSKAGEKAKVVSTCDELSLSVDLLDTARTVVY